MEVTLPAPETKSRTFTQRTGVAMRDDRKTRNPSRQRSKMTGFLVDRVTNDVANAATV